MNWLSENYKWMFDGIGAAALIGLIAWLWRRFCKEPAAENATVSVRDTQGTGSPIASGSQVTQNIHYGQPLAPASPAPSVPASTQDKPRPNIRMTGARQT